MPLPAVITNRPQLTGRFREADPLKNINDNGEESVDLLQTMVDISQQILDSQQRMFEKMLTMFDVQAEATTMQDVAGGVSGDTGMGIKDLLDKAGLGFLDAVILAFVAWEHRVHTYIRAAFKPAQIFGWIAKAFKLLFSIKIFDPIKDAIKGVVQAFKAGFKGIENFAKNWPKVTGLGKLGDFIKALGRFFRPIVSVFRYIDDLIGLSKTVSQWAGRFAKIMPFLKGFASKLLLPLFAIFDFISGFVSGFESTGKEDNRSMLQKVWDGAIGGLTKMLRGIFLEPLDLIKDLVSAGFKFFGADDIAKKIDELPSPSKLFDNIISGIKSFFTEVKAWWGSFDPVKAFTDLVGGSLKWITNFGEEVYKKYLEPVISNVKKLFSSDDKGSAPEQESEASIFDLGSVKEMSMNFLKSLLRMILPAPTDGIWGKIISSAIPKEVYEFAGLDPATGEATGGASIEAPTGVTPEGAAVATGSSEVAAARDRSVSTNVIAPNNSSSVVQTTTVNNTTRGPSPSPNPSYNPAAAFAGA